MTSGSKAEPDLQRMGNHIKIKIDFYISTFLIFRLKSANQSVINNDRGGLVGIINVRLKSAT